MGKRLAQRDVKPGLILSSPATRALTTAGIIAEKLDYKRKDAVLEVIHMLDDGLNCGWRALALPHRVRERTESAAVTRLHAQNFPCDAYARCLAKGLRNVRIAIQAELRARAINGCSLEDNSEIVGRISAVTIWIDVQRKREPETFSRKEIDDSYSAVTPNVEIKIRELSVVSLDEW